MGSRVPLIRISNGAREVVKFWDFASRTRFKIFSGVSSSMNVSKGLPDAWVGDKPKSSANAALHVRIEKDADKIAIPMGEALKNC